MVGGGRGGPDPELVGDIGVVIQLIDKGGTMCSAARGSRVPSRTTLDRIELREGDVVHGGLRHDERARGVELSEWAALRYPRRLRVARGRAAPVEAWGDDPPRAARRGDDERPRLALADILDRTRCGSTIRFLYMRPDAATVRRVGNRGCELQLGADAPSSRFPFEVRSPTPRGVGTPTSQR